MSKKYSDLIKISDEELINLYDGCAEHTSVGINYYAEEISRRRNEKTNSIMVNLTKWITVMTAVMLMGTLVNVLIAILK